MKQLPNMRGVTEALVVTVYEGEGIEGDPGRLVHYLYTKDGRFLGEIDTVPKAEIGK